MGKRRVLQDGLSARPQSLVRTPIDLEETPLPPYEKAPLLGEDTEDVLKELGYSDDEIKAAIEEGAVTEATPLKVLQGK